VCKVVLGLEVKITLTESHQSLLDLLPGCTGQDRFSYFHCMFQQLISLYNPQTTCYIHVVLNQVHQQFPKYVGPHYFDINNISNKIMVGRNSSQDADRTVRWPCCLWKRGGL